MSDDRLVVSREKALARKHKPLRDDTHAALLAAIAAGEIAKRALRELEARRPTSERRPNE